MTKGKTCEKISVTAMETMGQMVALQSCFNESFDKDDFMKGLIEKAQYIRMETKNNKKAVRLMAQLIKFYKFYYLLYLNKRWLNSQ